MSRKRACWAALYFAAALAGCGGGGGDGDTSPSISLAFQPSTINLDYSQGESRTFEVDVTASGEAAGIVYTVIEDPSGILSAPPLITSTSNLEYHAEFQTSSQLEPGRYRGSFLIHLCRDSDCRVKYRGSPFRLPYDITVQAVTLKSLLPYEDAAGLKLFDPREPFSSSNPKLVDVSEGQAWAGKVLMAADWDGTHLSDLRPHALTYVKGGIVYRVGLDPNGSHDPVRVSGITRACAVDRVLADYQTPLASWLLVAVQNEANSCTSPYVYRMVRANADASALGTSPPFSTRDQIQGVNNPDGRLSAFLTFETSSIVRRNADFAAPEVVLQAHNDGTSNNRGLSPIEGNFTSNIYFVARPGTSETPSMFRYRPGDGALTELMPALDYGGTPAFHVGAVDSDNYYFGSGGYTGAIYRVAHTATVPVRMSAEIADELRYPKLTNSRVVVERVVNGSRSGIYSLPKQATSAIPTAIVTPSSGFTDVYSADASGTLLITNITSGLQYTSYIARDDGTLLSTYPDSTWRMRIMDGVWDPTKHSAARYVLEAARSSVYSPSRKIIDAVTGSLISDLPGIVRNSAATSSVTGYGRYISFDVRIDQSPGNDIDAYCLDTISGTQARPVLTRSGEDERAVPLTW